MKVKFFLSLSPNIITAITLGFWSAIFASLFTILLVTVAIATSLMFPMKAWKGIQTYAENFNFLDLTSFIPAFREEFGWREAEQVQPITKIRLHY
jgi:hypothetical protein